MRKAIRRIKVIKPLQIRKETPVKLGKATCDAIREEISCGLKLEQWITPTVLLPGSPAYEAAMKRILPKIFTKYKLTPNQKKELLKSRQAPK